jgi:hypothetical protein
MTTVGRTLMQTSMAYIAIFQAEGMNKKTFPREF